MNVNILVCIGVPGFFPPANIYISHEQLDKIELSILRGPGKSVTAVKSLLLLPLEHLVAHVRSS